jgi:hypothetical protein
MELAILEGNQDMNDVYNAYSKLDPNERAELLGRSLMRRVGSKIGKAGRATQKTVLRPTAGAFMKMQRNPAFRSVQEGMLNVVAPGSGSLLHKMREDKNVKTAQSLVRKIAPSSPALALKIEEQVTSSPGSFLAKMRKITDQAKAANVEAVQNEFMAPPELPTPGINEGETWLEKLRDKIPAVKTETSLDLSNFKTPALIGGGLLLAYMVLKK